jgi:hypothetical protein
VGCEIDGLPKLYTLREVSDQTGFALRTLERDCRAGRVEHVHRGRERLMTAAQVQTLIEKHTHVAVTPADTKKIAAQQRLERMQRARLR